jgi:lipooligosaccharide transport system permease protein
VATDLLAGAGPVTRLTPSHRWLPIVEYQWRVYRRTWRGSIFGRVLTPVLMLLSLGLGLGALVDRGRGGLVWHGQVVPYLHFVVPGILASQGMTTGLGESSWPVMGAIKWQGTYHAMLATPARTVDILRAHAGYVCAQVGIGAALYLAVAALFGGMPSWWGLAALPVVVLLGLAFGLLMTALAARVESESWFTVVFRLVMTPLMLFSGTFFPAEQLPAFLQPLAWMTPLWHGVEACRALTLGDLSAWPLLGHVGVLALYAAMGWALASRALRWRLVR